ncbi:hypothetical protein BpHYR1_010509 [Brachionus plicatilis]|uniref:Uncharacterized protein n=1 Tax=Brachionus plicatilis TaxID=10195 RepID=A0A3M7SIM4_BRAPC|nr:hypothetical protein BpHYR1_010509 [Brachionus plicatilis]
MHERMEIRNEIIIKIPKNYSRSFKTLLYADDSVSFYIFKRKRNIKNKISKYSQKEVKILDIKFDSKLTFN